MSNHKPEDIRGKIPTPALPSNFTGMGAIGMPPVVLPPVVVAPVVVAPVVPLAAPAPGSHGPS